MPDRPQAPDGLRRTLLASVPAVLMAAYARNAFSAPAAVRPAAPEDAFAALEPYSGLYLLDDAHAVGVDRFFNDAGEGVLLFADFQSGVVRTLFPQADGTFAIGPGFAEPSPVELTLAFERDAADRIGAAELRPAGASARRAIKIATREEVVSFRNGDATLAGTLILPGGEGPHPAIVLLHGSGPLTRYSFGPYPRFFSSLGLAVLIFDKRGTGASTGRRLDASTGRPETLWPAFYPDDLLGDAVAALRLLQQRPDIDSARIGFWGSSEGGMLTTQVAALTQETAFVINSSGFMGPLWRTILYQGAAKMRAAGTSEDEIAEAVAFNRSWMEVGWSGEGYDAFRARREEVVSAGKTSWLFYEGAAFTSAEQLRWLMEHIMNFDPLPQVRRVRCPALGIFGADDVQTHSAEASRLMTEALAAGGNRDATVRIIPNAGHSLMETTSRARMAPGAFDTLRDWLAARV